ncbi:uncharacterized protein LOC123309511 [Coccinella septempunctata]|uniref:uncharacterized protein LOC123309511 n=1 Tax=Coccinella septempunctata TaxID=41139 RepID=UPI001D06544D|nr:uncharacterized protein LOC123309511 [Coccinella septempunctata]
MAKRLGDSSFNRKKISKKQKLDDHDETLWDDDLDDDCFDEIANKILEKDHIVQSTQENSSVLLTYNSFKPNIPFASTQNSLIPTDDFKKPQSMADIEDLKMKLTYLQQKCEAKEGEVSILRSQMKKFKSDMSDDLLKKQKEHLEIISIKEKELKSIKGQLDFKDLEIANLKQKILEVSKTNLNSSNALEMSKRRNIESSPRRFSSKNKDSASKITKEAERDFETFILLEPEYIEISKDFFDFFKSSTPEIHVVEARVSQFGRNIIPSLHNQMIQEESTLPPGPKLTVRISGREISLEDIYSEVFALFQCDITENNTEDKKMTINKLLGVSIELLKNFLLYLDQLGNIYRTEDIEQLDRIFLQGNSKEFDDNIEKGSETNCEIGVRAGRTIKVIAELLPYNDYIKDLLMSNQNHIDIFSRLEYLGDLRKKYFYFLLINDIVRRLFILRKTEVCTTFLDSVATLLVVISKEDLYDNILTVFTSLIGSILFTRPPVEILYKIMVVIKNCSKSKEFLNFLCLKPNCKKFTVDKKRKLNYFSEDTCKFTLFVSLLNNTLKYIKDEKLSIDVTCDVLSFVENIFTSDPCWVHDQQKDQCTCLEQLYQLIIEVLYWTLIHFKKKEYNIRKNKYVFVFKCGIRVLEILVFNSYDFIEKFIDSYSRYKEICKTLLELQEDLDLTEETFSLEKMCLFEEVPTASSSSLEMI